MAAGPLADQPPAPLDSERALAVVRILNQMAHQYQTAIIVVTHDEKIIPTFKRIYHIRDGRTYEVPLILFFYFSAIASYNTHPANSSGQRTAAATASATPIESVTE